MSGVVTYALSFIQSQSPNFLHVKCVGRNENALKTVLDELQVARAEGSNIYKAQFEPDSVNINFPLILYKCLQISDLKLAVPEVNVAVITSTCHSNTNSHLVPKSQVIPAKVDVFPFVTLDCLVLCNHSTTAIIR